MRPLILVLVTALTVALTGCGDDGGSGTAKQELSDTEHNAADVGFATEMIPHHAEAMVMVDLTRGRTLDAEVQQLAEQIRAARTPEIETMTDWLVSWGEEVPETIRDHANAGHGPMDADLDGLANASDAEFKELWLETMVEHHDDAVEMAHEEQTEGRYRPAVELAGSIIESQTEEIETMQGLLEP